MPVGVRHKVMALFEGAATADALLRRLVEAVEQILPAAKREATANIIDAALWQWSLNATALLSEVRAHLGDSVESARD